MPLCLYVLYVIVNSLLVVLTLQFLCHLMNNIFLKNIASEGQ